MAIKQRGGAFYIYFDPFRSGRQIGLKLEVQTKTEARQIEAAVLRACRTGDYKTLDDSSRDVCSRLFQNQRWELPPELGGLGIIQEPKQELTLWNAAKTFLTYPEICISKTKVRYEAALIHLVQYFGKDYPIKTLWVPDLKAYQIARIKSGAAPATVNWETATLSKLFGVLIEMRYVETNPVRLTKRLSVKSGERQAYLSLADVRLIADRCPEWYQPIVWTGFYTGMRRGEILGLTRKQINLKSRIITLSPADTKETRWKRVPIHLDLVPYLLEVLRLPSLLTAENVFLVRDEKGIRIPGKDTFKNPWPRACLALEREGLLHKPFPRFHDLRHTWKTNARRSGMDSEIRESILGHAERGKSVIERYGRISDEELLLTIDGMTFDHGRTEILVDKRKDISKEKSEHFLNKNRGRKKNQEPAVNLAS